MKYYLGIDLGGTSVRIAKIDDEGKISQDLKAPSHGQEGPEIITNNILELLKQFDLSDVEGIGFGVPGPVDTIRNVMTMASNIPGMEFYPLAQKVEEATGKKVYLDNDANVAGLAEAVLGAGKGKRIVYFVTHSTGVGGALIVNGHTVSGRNGYAGEVGNIIVKDNAEKINHLNAGACETEASGTALRRKAAEKFEGMSAAQDVFRLCDEGNKEALQLVDDMAKDMARMLQAVGHVVDPDVFVIGGGISNRSDLYWDKMIAYYNSMVHEGMKNVPFVKPIIKEPGVVGAAMLAKMANE